MSEKLIIAVPSKGRLEENTAAYFANAGLPLKRPDARGYSGRMEGLDNVEIAYLSASEIAARLENGSVHFGVTGEDLLREQMPDLESRVQLVTPLGFGRADVVVAVPDGWIDVTRMADLAEVAVDFRNENNRPMRVATKYKKLATDFLAKNNVYDVQIIHSAGATENMPNSGTAELIVDITSTGATLAANNLRVPKDGVILQSEAQLAASLMADWSAPILKPAETVLAQLGAWQEGKKMMKVDFVFTNSRKKDFQKIITTKGWEVIEKHGARFMNPSMQTSGNVIDDSFFVPTQNLRPFIAEWMEMARYEEAFVTKPDFAFKKENELYKKLIAALRPR